MSGRLCAGIDWLYNQSEILSWEHSFLTDQNLLQSHSIAALHFQKQLWLMQRLAPNVAVANISARLNWSGKLNIDALTAAINDYVTRHPYLGCQIAVSDDDGLVQQFGKIGPIEFKVVDLRFLSGEAQSEALQIQLDLAAKTPLPVTTTPPLRCTVIRSADEHYDIVFVFSHFSCDGLSMGILCKEFLAAYDARMANAQPRWRAIELLNVNDYSFNQCGSESVSEIRPSHRFVLPYSFPIKSVPAYYGEKISFALNETESLWINEASRQLEISPFVTWMTIINIVIAKYSSDKQFRFEIVKSGRTNEERRIVGPFFENVSLHLEVDRQQTLTELLVANQRRVNDLNLAQPHTIPAANARSQVLIDYQSLLQPVILSCGVEVSPSELDNGAATAELCFGIRRDKKKFAGHIKYDSELFDRPTIELMIERVRLLIRQLTRNMSCQIKNLQLLTDLEKQALANVNSAIVPFTTQTIDEQIISRLTDSGNSEVLRTNNESFNANQLVNSIHSISKSITSRGLKTGERVGMLLPRGFDAVASIIATMHSGCVYVPLDPQTPATRRQTVIEQADLKLIISNDRLCHLIDQQQLVLNVDHLNSEFANPITNNDRSAADSAYTIFTSGSTGQPKGVDITHANLANFCSGMDQLLVADSNVVWLASTNFTFDISLLEILWTLSRGFKLILSSSADVLANFSSLVVQNEITHFQCTPSMLNLLLAEQSAAEGIGQLKVLLVGGEELTESMSQRLIQLCNGRAINMYGPTETTIWSTCWPIEPNALTSIGRPLRNQSVYIVDEDLIPMPPGCIGEILIGGNSVGRGYCNDTQSTNAKFINHPEFGKVYRTGDLAKLNLDGTIRFVGRKDNQVKIAGHRIELGDVESMACSLDKISNCVAWLDEESRALSLAFCRNKNRLNFSVTDCQQELKDKLPTHMIPTVWHELDEIPLNSSGKIDRKAAIRLSKESLCQTIHDKDFDQTYDEIEHLAELIKSELKIDSLPLDSNWTELGISSLDTLGLVLKVEKELGLSFPVSQVFSDSSIRSTLATITGQKNKTPLIRDSVNQFAASEDVANEFEEGVI